MTTHSDQGFAAQGGSGLTAYGDLGATGAPDAYGLAGPGGSPGGRPGTDVREARPGSDGEHLVQQRLGTTERADRFYDDQVLDHLNDRMREFVGRQEMFFLATADRHGECDSTFRAGPPGFLQVLDERTLAYPEYRGNGVMASVGNLSENPHLGILMIDFTGDRIGLHVNGRARVVMDDEMRARHPDLPTDPVPGRRAQLWVEVAVEETYIHCAKHIPHLQKVPRQASGSRAWGTDDARRKGGDFFGAAAEAAARREERAGQEKACREKGTRQEDGACCEGGGGRRAVAEPRSAASSPQGAVMRPDVASRPEADVWRELEPAVRQGVSQREPGVGPGAVPSPVPAPGPEPVPSLGSASGPQPAPSLGPAPHPEAVLSAAPVPTPNPPREPREVRQVREQVEREVEQVLTRARLRAPAVAEGDGFRGWFG
ncbi:hydrolase [Streptomyces chrestomyceticus JCM 4735]|uniref:Hydrolase n=1 Tax=Streptomyces chrestomyceticus JCM 4735 TaxID=1306181 RepID=A0A7U9KWX6_9ACTN|nr:hydrolase [Streptomyces chrestomyceticus JCM 4735]